TPLGRKGEVRIRASVLPPNFQLSDPDSPNSSTNRRFDIMKANHGLMICREGRHIDTVRPEWTKFQNYDLNLKVEVDFDAELDEAFGITTSKQQITINDWMWDMLKGHGQNNGNLVRLVRDMRVRVNEMRDDLAAKSATQDIDKEQSRPSVVAMEESEKFST